MIQGWKSQIERQYLQALRERGTVAPHEVAERLGVSEQSAVFWLTMLARDGKVRITGIESTSSAGDDAHSHNHEA